MVVRLKNLELRPSFNICSARLLTYHLSLLYTSRIQRDGCIDSVIVLGSWTLVPGSSFKVWLDD